MKNFAAVVACQVAALAASANAEVAAGPFGVAAYKAQVPGSSDPYFLSTAINASAGKFYVNKPTSTYCPAVAGIDCSLYAGTGTTLVQGEGSNTISLDVTTPGGQQVYIAPDGSLSYTIAHSAFLPEGSVSAGFSRVDATEAGAPVVLDVQARVWSLCPASADVSATAAFQLFASVSALPNCFGVEVRSTPAADGQVWQYA